VARHKDEERNRVISETRRLLLDAATAEFAREGYNGANINRISKAAGFAKGTVYNYFPSKRALMLALIEEIAASHHAFVAEQVWQEEEDPILRLRRFFRAGLEWITHNLPRGRVMLAMLNGPDVEFKQRMGQGYQPMHQLIINDILIPGMDQGIFVQREPAPTAGLLMMLYLGIGSSVDEEGRSRLEPEWIAELVLGGLRRTGRQR
jgi:AcrR family transcriptional regulator